MPYVEAIRAARSDPQRLEDLYQTACRGRKQGEFSADLETCYQQAPENLLYAAWHFRLAQATPAGEETDRNVNWKLAVAILTVLINLYALSATVFRTVEGGLTMNRLTIIGWNSINIGILLLLVCHQFRNTRVDWIRSAQRVFGWGTIGYMAWTLFVILVVPLLFKG